MTAQSKIVGAPGKGAITAAIVKFEKDDAESICLRLTIFYESSYYDDIKIIWEKCVLWVTSLLYNCGQDNETKYG